MKISKSSYKIWERLFFPLVGQINFSHFENVCEREKGGNGGATFDIDMEVEGARTWKG